MNAQAHHAFDNSIDKRILSRMLKTRSTLESDASAADDGEWHTEETLEIAPHPSLSGTQARIIALDHGMQSGEAEIKVRRALLYYAVRRLGVDTDPSAREPQYQQIVLLKKEAMHEITA